jgi:hypothetical protein
MRVIDHSALDVADDNEEKMYLVMQLMKAGSLEKRVALYKDSLDSTLQVAMALADGLGHALWPTRARLHCRSMKAIPPVSEKTAGTVVISGMSGSDLSLAVRRSLPGAAG